METNQQFVDSLIVLRDHYQALNEEYEHQGANVKEQLTHINALVVADTQLLESQQHQEFIDSLMAIRDHYQALNDEYGRKAANARQQLIHVNALLVDQLVQQQNQQPVSMQASTENQKQTPVLTGAADITGDKSSQEIGALPQPASFEPARGTASNQTAIMQSEPAQGNAKDVAPDSPSRFLPATKTAMLPKYQHLTKLQAVESLLKENAGTILHIDYIIRTLYGELEPDALIAEKTRMHDTLKTGMQKGLWDRVPDQAGCYTIDLKLLEPEPVPDRTEITRGNNKIRHSKINRPQRRQSRGKSLHMLPPYHQLSLIDAVEAIVRSHLGKSLTIAFVVQELYGELSGNALSEAKERVGEALWRGSKQKRWQRVPKQMGCYTLDLKLMDSELAAAAPP
jgi:hypothetical protein